MITIYGSDGMAKTQVPCDDNSTQEMELQGDNALSLSFTLYEHVALEVNDYAEFMGRKYWLMERYHPEQVSTVEWKYDIKLYGIESLVKRFLVINDTDGNDEPVFTLTAPPRDHVALIVKSINNGMGTGDWKVGTVEGADNIVIDYFGKYCDEALKEVAEKVGHRAEWWVEGQTVNICRCEQGEEVTLAYGKGLLSLSGDMADNAKFYTRLYPIGSSRNIDPEKYGHTRLQLPGGVKHVDVNVDKYGVWHHYEAEAFAGIYPKRIGTVSSVRKEETKDEEGNPSGKLPVTFVREVGQIPMYYNHNNTGRPAQNWITPINDIPLEAPQTSLGNTSFYLDSGKDPLFAFGYGLSYSTFEYSDLNLSSNEVNANDTLTVTATIKNTSDIDGTEVVQLYVRDLVGSITRPVKELKGFQRLALKAGEAQTVSFKLPISELAFYGKDLIKKVEAGQFDIWVAPNSTEGLKGSFTVKE